MNAMRPLALQTSAVPSLTLIDLVPGAKYYLSVRSHPAENNIVWGWREATDPVLCMEPLHRLEEEGP